MEIAVLGIDLGKNSCSIVGLDNGGAVAATHAPRRSDQAYGQAEAMRCSDGGLLRGAPSRPRSSGPRSRGPADVTEYVRPYVKSQKNDDRDAEAIAEAATRPTMRFVELKSEEQLDVQTLHRARDRLVGERTALINLTVSEFSNAWFEVRSA
jgi:transposase